MRDYGGIYLWGYQPNSKIFENYVFEAHSMFGDGPGIYLDEGYDEKHCSGFTVENNVLENNDVDLYLHVAENNVIINFSGSLWDGGLTNQFIQDGSLDVDAVKANAGLEQDFVDIKALSTLSRVGPRSVSNPITAAETSALSVDFRSVISRA